GVLQLLALGEKDGARFPWLDPPREETVAAALTLLRRLGAVDEQGVTDLGRVLARLPVHPRLGRLLAEGSRLGYPGRAALAAALLSERDPFPRALEPTQAAAVHITRSDVLDRIEALEEFEQHGRCTAPPATLNGATARFILRARDQLLRLLRPEVRRAGAEPDAAHAQGDADECLLRSLLAAFPDRLA